MSSFAQQFLSHWLLHVHSCTFRSWPNSGKCSTHLSWYVLSKKKKKKRKNNFFVLPLFLLLLSFFLFCFFFSSLLFPSLSLALKFFFLLHLFDCLGFACFFFKICWTVVEKWAFIFALLEIKKKWVIFCVERISPRLGPPPLPPPTQRPSLSPSAKRPDPLLLLLGAGPGALRGKTTIRPEICLHILLTACFFLSLFSFFLLFTHSPLRRCHGNVRGGCERCRGGERERKRGGGPETNFALFFLSSHFND